MTKLESLIGRMGMTLPPAEIDRRRQASIERLKQRDCEEWAEKYQEHCDRLYWTNGPCCAGCDHWRSDTGNLGRCTAAGIVSGDQVMASMGIEFCSYTPRPGFPMTKADFHCGMFEDDFDWSSLPIEYLARIGAKL